MKKTFLSIILIICSLISGIIGTYLAIKYGRDYLELGPKIIKEETLKTEKVTSVISLQNDITKIVKELSPGVVSIVIKKDLILYRQDPFGFFQEQVGTVNKKIGGGTGFFISKDGMIITNKHVVSDSTATYSVITNDGSSYDAKILAFDPVTDLAIIQITTDKNLIALDFVNDSDELNIGQFAIAIGNALAEFQNSVSLGVLSGKNRTLSDENFKLAGLLQTDAAINPGNSGGPLVNIDGKVIGINTAIVNGSTGLGFSIPLTREKIDYLIQSIQKYGTIKRPFIGISYIQNSQGVMDEFKLKTSSGAYIPEGTNSIIPGSSAEIAGILPGSIILEVNGVELTQEQDLNSILSTKIPGEKIDLKIFTPKGDKKTISLTLGEK